MKLTTKINRQAFIKAFNDMKIKQNMSTIDVARNAKLSKSFIYHSTSKKGGPIEVKTVYKIGKGLGLTKQQVGLWLSEIYWVYLPHVTSARPTKLRKELFMDNTVANVLQIAMHDKKMTVKDLADKSGLKFDDLNAILSGTIENIRKIPKSISKTYRVQSYMHQGALLTKWECTILSQTLDIPVIRLYKAIETTSIIIDTYVMKVDVRREHVIFLKRLHKIGIHTPIMPPLWLVREVSNAQPLYLRPDVEKAAKELEQLDPSDIAILSSIIKRMQRAEIADAHQMYQSR